MSNRGLASRRQADEFIQKGWVKVDGKIVNQLGTKVLETAKIELQKEATGIISKQYTIAINKPVGYVSSQPEDNYIPAIRLVRKDSFYSNGKQTYQPLDLSGLAPVGRLDIDSKGLLLLSTDRVFIKKLIGPDSCVEKEYLVRVTGLLTDQKLNSLRHGLTLDERELKPARIDVLAENLLRMVLKEGRKRQIRRMCQLVELNVTELKRVRIGKLALGTLPEGKWQIISPDSVI